MRMQICNCLYNILVLKLCNLRTNLPLIAELLPLKIFRYQNNISFAYESLRTISIDVLDDKCVDILDNTWKALDPFCNTNPLKRVRTVFHYLEKVHLLLLFYLERLALLSLRYLKDNFIPVYVPALVMYLRGYGLLI